MAAPSYMPGKPNYDRLHSRLAARCPEPHPFLVSHVVDGLMQST